MRRALRNSFTPGAEGANPRRAWTWQGGPFPGMGCGPHWMRRACNTLDGRAGPQVSRLVLFPRLVHSCQGWQAGKGGMDRQAGCLLLQYASEGGRKTPESGKQDTLPHTLPLQNVCSSRLVDQEPPSGLKRKNSHWNVRSLGRNLSMRVQVKFNGELSLGEEEGK